MFCVTDVKPIFGVVHLEKSLKNDLTWRLFQRKNTFEIIMYPMHGKQMFARFRKHDFRAYWVGAWLWDSNTEATQQKSSQYIRKLHDVGKLKINMRIMSLLLASVRRGTVVRLNESSESSHPFLKFWCKIQSHRLPFKWVFEKKSETLDKCLNDVCSAACNWQQISITYSNDLAAESI